MNTPTHTPTCPLPLRAPPAPDDTPAPVRSNHEQTHTHMNTRTHAHTHTHGRSLVALTLAALTAPAPHRPLSAIAARGAFGPRVPAAHLRALWGGLAPHTGLPHPDHRNGEKTPEKRLRNAHETLAIHTAAPFTSSRRLNSDGEGASAYGTASSRPPGRQQLITLSHSL